MPLLSFDYINQCFLLDFMLKIDKKKLPLHESHFVKATAPCCKKYVIRSALFRFRIFHPEGIYGDALHHLIFHGSVGVVGSRLGDFIHIFHPLDHLAECGIAAVQMRACLVHDEKLGTGGVGSHAPCHGEHALRVL